MVVGDELIPIGCREDVAISVTNLGAVDSARISILIESFREPLASGSLVVNILTNGERQVIESPYEVEVGL